MMKAKSIRFRWKMVLSILTMMFLFLTVDSHLNAQNFYGSQQAISILKEEISNLEGQLGLTKQQTAQTNLLAARVVYYSAVLNQIAAGETPAQAVESNVALMIATGSDREYGGFNPISKTEADAVKTQLVDLISE